MAVKPLPGAQLDRTHPLAQGLVGCWLMNEGGGLSVHDYSGNDNSGLLENGPVWSPGVDGWACAFPGTTDSARLPAASFPNGDAWSFVVRMQMTAKASIDMWQPFVSYLHYNADGGMMLRTFGTKFPSQIILQFGKSVTSVSGALYQNVWYDLCVTYKDAHSTVYQDGVVVLEVDRTYVPATVDYLRLARRQSNSGTGVADYSYCSISCYANWDRALTADEVAWLAAEPYAMFVRPDRWRRVFDFGESGGIIRPRGPRTLRVGPRMILGGVI